MPATLTKIIDGKPVISDTLTNEQTVKCPRCEQTYRLGYSDGEWFIMPSNNTSRKLSGLSMF